MSGVVSLAELSRDGGHKRGAPYRKSTILGRGIKDLSSRPQRQRAARCSAVRCRCSEVVNKYLQTLESCGDAVRCGSALDDRTRRMGRGV